MSIFSKMFGDDKGDSKMNTGTRSEQFISALKTDLNLTPEQVSGVENALRNFYSEKKSIKQAGGGKDEMRGSKQDFKQDILTVLNPEQKQKFMANVQTYKQLLKR
jgi:hypothetical protein